MNALPRDRGFIKAIIFFAIALGVVLLFLSFFAKYFAPSSFIGNLTGTSTSGGGFLSGSTDNSTYTTKTNPLIDFSNFNSGGGYSYTSDEDRSKPNTDGKGLSPHANRVSLSAGSAASTYQTFEEYVILRNSGPAVNVTGWTLTNGKGTRPIENMHTNYVYPTAESATIGFGTEFLAPSGNFVTGPIVLKTGDIAYITTGRPYSQYPFSIYTSFRENICVGYLKNYPFYPSLNMSCPIATDDPLIRTVTDQCYDYMRSLRRCTTPEKEDKARFEATTSQCQQFIRPRLSYNGCVERYQTSSNFYTKTWRVFLSKDRELWASRRETITLYDASGLIVDQISY